jgi:hypothetical protein
MDSYFFFISSPSICFNFVFSFSFLVNMLLLGCFFLWYYQIPLKISNMIDIIFDSLHFLHYNGYLFGRVLDALI